MEENKSTVEATVVNEVPAKINWGRAANMAALAMFVAVGCLYVSSRKRLDTEELELTTEPSETE